MKLFVLFFTLGLFGVAHAQTDSTQPPYKRFPTVAPFKILLSDSTTMYSKADLPAKKAVLIMVFDPNCTHCQHETEEIIAHKKQFKNIEIVLITMNPLWMMRNFISKYELEKFSNLVVGRDIYYFTQSFFNFHNIPFLASYNKNGDLIQVFEGSVGIEKVIDSFNIKD